MHHDQRKDAEPDITPAPEPWGVAFVNKTPRFFFLHALRQAFFLCPSTDLSTTSFDCPFTIILFL
jgi:hypothetical protein